MNKQFLQTALLPSCNTTNHLNKQTNTSIMRKVLLPLLVAFLFLAGLPNLSFGQTIPASGAVTTTSGYFTYTAGTYQNDQITVQLWAGGGGGGAADYLTTGSYCEGGAGAGGSYVSYTVQLNTSGTQRYYYYVGTGGAGAATSSTTGQTGVAGQPSYFAKIGATATTAPYTVSGTTITTPTDANLVIMALGGNPGYTFGALADSYNGAIGTSGGGHYVYMTNTAGSKTNYGNYGNGAVITSGNVYPSSGGTLNLSAYSTFTVAPTASLGTTGGNVGGYGTVTTGSGAGSGAGAVGIANTNNTGATGSTPGGGGGGGTQNSAAKGGGAGAAGRIVFTYTVATTPNLTTTAATGITSTGATLAGNISSTSTTVTANGIVSILYATNTNPTTATSGVTNTTATAVQSGAFSVSLTGLSVNTQYAYNAYATNTGGTGYGTASSFWTLANTPTTPTVGAATSTTLGVTIGASDGNPTTTTYAIYNSTTSQYVQANGSLGASAAYQTAATWGTITVTGLSASTSYTFYTVAQNGAGTATSASSTASASTTAASAPILTTTAATSITTTGATLAGNITAAGSTSVTANGIVSILYATTANPTTATSGVTNTTATAVQSGAFSVSVTGLSVNTQYAYNAYATNTAGTGYGASTSFWTLANTPTTPTVGSATATTLGVAIGASDGNPSTTTYAIYCTTASKYVQANGSLNTTAVYQTASTWATVTVTGLTPSTSYGFYTMAQNGAGTATSASSTASASTSVVSSFTISDNGTPSTIAGVSTSSTNNILQAFKIVEGANSSSTISSVVASLTGTYVAGDIATSGFKLWAGSTNSFASATNIKSVSSSTGNGESITFSSLTTAIPASGTVYFWITVDINSAGTANHTITAASLTSSAFTFASGSISAASVNASAGFSIVVAPTAYTPASGIAVTTSGNYTFTVPTGVTSLQVEAWGAGGGGGAANTTQYSLAGGGAGGAYVSYTISVTPGTTYYYTVGTGGASGVETGGSTAHSGTDGAAGGSTYFGSTSYGVSTGASVLAVGGNGGYGTTQYCTVSNSSNIWGVGNADGLYGVTPTQTSGNIPTSGTGLVSYYGTPGGAAGNGSSIVNQGSPAVPTVSTKSSGAGGAGAGPTGSTSGGAGGASQTSANPSAAGTAPGGGASGECKVTACQNGCKTTGAGGNGQIKFTYSVFIPASITPSVSSLTGLSYASGNGPSTSQSFTVSGANLTGYPSSLTVQAPTDYEVSTDGGTTWSGAAGTETISFTSATLTAQTVVVRLVAGKSAGNYNSETVSIYGGGVAQASASTVSVSGSVTVNPLITPSVSSLTGFSYVVTHGPSTTQSFTITGGNLTGAPGSITITASADYEVSTNGGTTWSGSNGTATVSYSSATLSAQTILVRLVAVKSVASYNSETISISGGGASASITASGSVNNPAAAFTISDNGTPSTIANVNPSSNSNNILQAFKVVEGGGSGSTISSVAASLTGTYVAADVASSGFILWAGTTNSFASATQIATASSSSSGTGETVTFSSLSTSIAANSTEYFWITVNVSSSATNVHTITANALTSTAFTFASGSITAASVNASAGFLTVYNATTSNLPTTGSAATPGTYYFTVPSGVSTMTFSCWGGGGGSGGCGNTYNQAGGGSSGGAVQYTLTGLTVGEVFYYSVGAGGTGAAASTGTGVNGGGNGGNGGNTVLGTAVGSAGSYTLGTILVSASGGIGSVGTGFSTSGTSSSVYYFTANAAQPTSNTVNTSLGISGYSGLAVSGTPTNTRGVASVTVMSSAKASGAGGTAPSVTSPAISGGTGGASSTSANPGIAGSAPGGGASGAILATSTSNSAGAAGGAGEMVFTYVQNPSITPSVASITSGLSYALGNGPSASQSFTVSGANLTGYPSTLTVQAPTDYEVSTDGGTTWSGAAGTETISFTSATLTAQTVVVRLVAGKSAGNYNSENVSIYGGGVAQVSASTVSVSGSVTVTPLISPSVSSLTGFSYVVTHGPSATQSFTISGGNLTGAPGSITVTASADYEVSTNGGSTWSGANGTATVSYSTATLSAQTILVRLVAGKSVASYNSETISISGGGATASITASGSVNNPAAVFTISDNGTRSTIANVNPSSNSNNILQTFKVVEGSGTASTISTVAASLTGTYISADIASSGFKLWAGSTNSFASATQIGSSVSSISGSGETITFSSLTTSIPASGTVYFWITVNVSTSAINGHTITASALTSSAFTFSSGSISAASVNASAGYSFLYVATSNTPTSGTAVTTAGNYYFTVPANTYSLTVSCYGGGGGSGGAGNSWQQTGGGSSGGAVQYTLTGLTPGQVFYYTVGAGGTAGIGCSTLGQAGTGTNGGNGGATVFGTATGSSPYSLGTTIISASGGIGSAGAGTTTVSSSVYIYTANAAQPSANTVNTTLGISGYTGLTVAGTPTNLQGVAGTTVMGNTKAGGSGAGGKAPNLTSPAITGGSGGASQTSASPGAAGGVPGGGAGGPQMVTSTSNTAGAAGGKGEILFTYSVPTVTPSTTSITANNYQIGSGPATASSFTITATGLNSGVLTFGGLTNYEVSTDGGNTYGSSKTLAYTAPSISTTTIYVRLKAGILVAQAYNETLSISGGSLLSTVTVSLTGSVLPSTLTTWNGTSWSAGVPNNTTAQSVVINGNLNSNILTTCNNLTIGSGATFTTTSTVNVIGTLTNGGTIAGAGIINLNSGTTQSIAGTGTLSSLTLSTTGTAATITGTQNITGILKVNSGTTLNTGGNLTLKSTSISNSATVDVVGGSITGNVTVERYIPSGYRGYRDLAPQVYNSSYTTGNIFTNWQEGGSLTHNGYGIFITGSTSTDATVADYNAGQLASNGTTGLDYSLYGNASAFTFNNSNGSFYSQYAVGEIDSIANTKTTNLDVFTGYRVLVRGDRSFNLATTPILNYPAGLRMYNPTTLRATGSLVTGTVTYSTTGVTGTANGSGITSANALNANATVITNGKITQGLSMLANPYACPVSWTSVYNNSVTAGSNINGTWYFLDPTYGATGTYEGYNYATGSQFSDETNASDLIQAGQAFFVLNALTSPTPKVVFTESAKQATSTKTATFGAVAPLSKIYVGVFKETNGTYSRTDGAAVAFRSDFTDKSFGTQDVLKVGYGSDNIAVSDKGVELGIDGRLPATASDAIALKIGSPTATSYQLQVDASRYINEGYAPLLYDAYKNTTTALGTGVTTVNFTVDAKTASTYANRFTILFTPSALAVNSIVASASLNNKIATITWNTVGEKGESYFEVEKSTDGKNFASIAKQTAKNTSNASYTATDNSVVSGNNYYRIKAVSTTGAVSYSNVAKLTNNSPLTTYALYPNPLTGKTLNVSLSNVVAGKYVVSIYNVLGQKVNEQTITHAGGNATHALTINNTLAKGIYSVTIREAASNQIVHQTSLSFQP